MEHSLVTYASLRWRSQRGKDRLRVNSVHWPPPEGSVGPGTTGAIMIRRSLSLQVEQ